MKRFQLKILLSVCLFAAAAWAADPLPSWNDTAPKQALFDFVDAVTRPGSPQVVPPAERIAVFDNDGTLWAEQPMYFQAFFIIDRIKALAPQHPEWETREPFASVLKGDMKTVMAGGEHALLEMAMATHAGMTTEEFEEIVSDWISTAKHPETGRLLTRMVYQPMLELLTYLRANGFKTFVVSGGGIEFMRPWMENVYGIPPEQVVGSSIVTKFEMRDGIPVLMRLPEMNFVDDKEGKPVGINSHIGRRPIAAFGNSDGDLQMLQWTDAGEGARFCLYVHHTDAEREWAYDRDSSIGRLEQGLEEARLKGWTVMDMKKDWKTIFPPQENPLLGSEWLVEDIAGKGVIDFAQTTVEFGEAGRVSGSTACNRYTASVEVEGNHISLGPMASTQMACPDAVMEQEQRFLTAMPSVRSYAFDHDGSILYFLDENGVRILRMSKKEEQ